MVARRNQKREALSVQRLINEVLIQNLGIPSHNVVNDATFQKYTGSLRPDILISNMPYANNPNDPDDEIRFVENLICYVEAKDITCKVNDADWKDAIAQGKTKAPKLGLNYFGVTNCNITYFYNLAGDRLSLNGAPMSEFQTMDVLRIIKKKTNADAGTTDIDMGVDALTAVSEAVFNSKLWQLKNIYRAIDFENNTKKIDFTVGLISMEYYEEKARIDGTFDASKKWWSTAKDLPDNTLASTLVGYIDDLTGEDSDFREFSTPIKVVKTHISGSNPLVKAGQLREIYNVVDSMRPLHGTGFDLFGAVYEAFANSKEKKDFGEYFTRRHYTHIFAKLLLGDRDRYNPDNEFTIIDPFVGTGGMLTEAYKVLRSNFEESNTMTPEAAEFLSSKCFYGVDLRSENASRSKLNMFLVGDGHNHIYSDDSLVPAKKDGKEVIGEMAGSYDYVITNPPYGQGTILADTVFLSSRRMEVAAICRVIDLLRIDGRACIVTPDGVLENPSFQSFREELMLTCEIQAVISLPKFAFAPYTKEKTYALFLKKRYERFHISDDASQRKETYERRRQNGKFQATPIWMYIVDNDGFANSDKRYPTRLRGEDQHWLHDEVSGWVDGDGVEHVSKLEERWNIRYDDAATCGTTWRSESGDDIKKRKGGNIAMDLVRKDTYLTLLPERYLRPYDPHFVTPDEFRHELNMIGENIDTAYAMDNELPANPSEPEEYQVRNQPVKDILDCLSGNTGLTEELIYNMSGVSGPRYEVLTASTQSDTAMGSIPQCNLPTSNGQIRPLKTFSDKEGLLVVRKGKAGGTRYLPKGNYTINDDAYILSVKDDCPYRIDLRWFAIAYKSEFLAYASNSDNGTWNKTGFFESVTIDIPSPKTQQALIQTVDKAQRLAGQLELAQRKLNILLNKEIDRPVSNM